MENGSNFLCREPPRWHCWEGERLIFRGLLSSVKDDSNLYVGQEKLMRKQLETIRRSNGHRFQCLDDLWNVLSCHFTRQAVLVAIEKKEVWRLEH